MKSRRVTFRLTPAERKNLENHVALREKIEPGATMSSVMRNLLNSCSDDRFAAHLLKHGRRFEGGSVVCHENFIIEVEGIGIIDAVRPIARLELGEDIEVLLRDMLAEKLTAKV